MINKVYEIIKKDIKENYKTYIIFILIVSSFFIKLDYNVYTPGGLIELTDRIEVENAYESKGSFNMTYVSAKKGILPVILMSYIFPSWDLVSLDDSRIESESEGEIIERNKIYLEETSYDAIISAFTEANIPYEVKSIDVTVTFVYSEANTNIEVGDIVKSVDGKSISNFKELTDIVSTHKENDRLIINVLRGNKIVECYANLIKTEDKVLIGVMLSELKDIETNPKVNYIFKNNESGSSRGLMCALDIYNKITKFDLTKGDIISGTGTINELGEVGEIDGVKYKLAGAVKKGAKVMIVPTKNYEEALKLKKDNNYDIELIEADNLHNVIEKLRKR